MSDTNPTYRKMKISKILISVILVLYLILILYPLIELVFHLITIDSKVERKEYIKPFIDIGLSEYMYTVYSKMTIFYFISRQTKGLQYSVPTIIFLLFLINKNSVSDLLQKSTKLSNIFILRFNMLDGLPYKEVYEFSSFVLSFIITTSFVYFNDNSGFVLSYLISLFIQVGLFYTLQLLFSLCIYFTGTFNTKEVFYLFVLNCIIHMIKGRHLSKKDFAYFYTGNVLEINNILFGIKCANLIKEVLETNGGSFKIKFLRSSVVTTFNIFFNKYFPFIPTSCIYLATPTLNFIFGGFRGVILHQLQHVINNNSLVFNIFHDYISWPSLIFLFIQTTFILLVLWHLKNIKHLPNDHKLLIRIILIVLSLFGPVFTPLEIFLRNCSKMKMEFQADLLVFKNNYGRDLLVFISVFLNIFNNDIVCGPISLYTTCFIDFHPTLDKRLEYYNFVKTSE